MERVCLPDKSDSACTGFAVAVDVLEEPSVDVCTLWYGRPIVGTVPWGGDVGGSPHKESPAVVYLQLKVYHLMAGVAAEAVVALLVGEEDVGEPHGTNPRSEPEGGVAAAAVIVAGGHGGDDGVGQRILELTSYAFAIGAVSVAEFPSSVVSVGGAVMKCDDGVVEVDERASREFNADCNSAFMHMERHR